MQQIIKKLIYIFIAVFSLTLVLTLLYQEFIYPTLVKTRLNQNLGCSQAVVKACFLRTPICVRYPNPCNVPPLWFQTR
jgi:hypothetical protein